MLDGTYKVNRLRMPLYALAVVDSEGHGQPVAHALLAHENQEHIDLFLHDVAAWNPDIFSSVFVTDKDFAEINAISSVVPNAQIFQCHFYIMKAFTDEMKRQAVSDADTLLTVWYHTNFVQGTVY